MTELWKPLTHDEIADGFMLSTLGRIKTKDTEPHEAIYHSTNGYDFHPFLLKPTDTNGPIIPKIRLFPIDDLLAMTFVPPSEELIGKRVKVVHIDGDNRNNHVDNFTWVEDIEEWKLLVDQPLFKDRFEVSNFGRVRNAKTHHVYVNQHDLRGYENVSLYFCKTEGVSHTKRRTIHKLVASAFCPIENTCSELEVNHINGIKNCNYWKNLEWVTRSQNRIHAFETGLEIHFTNLTIEQMDMIRDMLLQDEYDCSPSKVYNALNHSLYPHITYNIIANIKYGISDSYRKSMKYDLTKFSKMMKMNNKISNQCAIEVKELLEKYNGSIKCVLDELHEKYPMLTYDNINNIKRGKSHK